ncbi:MAG: ornithine cyclodeaminase family protein [Rhodobacteraceae bacterium]|nr:ornithine cyclodeaminase family protein [Paracoccaceae bacterium]
MAQVFKLDEILDALKDIDVVDVIAQGFKALSEGKVVIPPIGEMLFPDVDGELHIKYGAIKGDEDFVVKMATGFFQNPSIGLSPFSGCMMVFSQKTGHISSVLLEEGELTNHRTAAAGAVAAKCLAPKNVSMIGIVGTGVQSRLQALYLQKITDCRNLVVWGRNKDKVELAAADMQKMGYEANVVENLNDLCKVSQIIVTTTPATSPLLKREMITPGTHITAMGSDTSDKCELSPEILDLADIVAADSIEQAIQRGEISQALKAGKCNKDKLVELGSIIIDPSKGRTNDQQITIADLSGVAIQDIMIAKAVTDKLGSK